ncbi:MAG: transporter [Gemmatimonadota bacterium]|nr:transporter [Gemmatimonadota bacterium]
MGAEGRPGRETLWKFVLVGIFLGVVFTKAEVISWFRIQEMFRFQSFHMYGIIGSAVFVGAISILLIRRLEARTVYGDPIRLADKESRGRNYRYWIGGGLFGLGWGLLGACPGPIFALIGNGVTVLLVSLAAALVGTWSYGWLRPHLPHH